MKKRSFNIEILMPCLRLFLVAGMALLWPFTESGAQRVTWSIDFGSVFDNREGDHSYTPTETYFFTNLAPEIGLELGERDRIAGGGGVEPAYWARMERGAGVAYALLAPSCQALVYVDGYVSANPIARGAARFSVV